MTHLRIGAACALVLSLALVSVVACSRPSTGTGPAHSYGAQIPAAQNGQGPIPEFADTPSLAAFPTTGMNTGFLATVGSAVYAFSSTATLPTDAGAGAVAGANGGAWLLFANPSGTKITVSQAGIFPLYTEGGASTVPWTTAAVLEVSGVLLVNATISLPNVPGMLWTIRNNTTGSFTLTVNAAGGTGFVVATGKSAIGYIDDSSGTTGNFVRVSPDT